MSQDLRLQLNCWLNHSDFGPIKDLLLNQLNPSDRIRLIIQTDNPELRRLPWHQWELCDRYPKAEIALATVTFLVEPERRQLNDQLWAQPWDIRFFAGHSLSNAKGQQGQIAINPQESLTIPQLKHGLKASIA